MGSHNTLGILDFAASVCSPIHSKDIQEKPDSIDKTAKAVGLKIHPTKSKVMKLKTHTKRKILVQGEEIE